LPATNNHKKKFEHHYWRVIVRYRDGETSGNRVFKDREKAERFAARQEKSKVVKKAVLEPFVRQQYGGRRVSE
jgi:IMP dehydrogenase/GMP reductase